MNLDDDQPDYFLADEESGQRDDGTPGKVIDFTDGSTAPQRPDDNGTATHRPRHTLRKVMVWTGVIGVVTLGLAFYLRYVSPYAVDAVMRAYVVNVEKRGLIFKTYEAQVVSADALADTANVYSHPEHFTIADEALAQRLQQLQGRRIPVTLEYEKFYATLPWRGSSKWVVTGIKP